MDLRRLEAFAKVFELKSFSKAALALFVSQPTVSSHISSLEAELGSLLFDRLGRSIVPTPAGEVLYRHVVQAFANLERAKHEVRLLQDHVAGDLVIGASTIPANYLLPGVLAGFLAKYADVRLHLKVGDSLSVALQVSRGELPLGVVGAMEDHPDLTYTPLLMDELVVIAPWTFFPEAASLQPEELSEWPWVVREPGSGTRRSLERALATVGMNLSGCRIVAEVEGAYAALQCVKAGLGLSVASRLAAAELLERNEVAEIHVPALSLNRSLYCVHHARRDMMPAMQLFIEYLRERAGGV